ncbi:antiviral innate immune response receptor RIG-I-like isoform X2 [Saccostrea echinata]|uniref:antiviral innate immune response receptor RIG-I-like isoform X2 n=1 Tax=Saccostrea echinata TaxID=191078 RepID=UPI002A80EBEC|nr:antiviral innate immune response receptor RIG-I-like isoform X2 [Saccostrea echinata]
MMDSNHSLKLDSAPLLDQKSLTQPSTSDSLQLPAGEKLGSSIFNEDSDQKYVLRQSVASKENEVTKHVQETSGQKMAIQRADVLYHRESNNSMKASGHVRAGKSMAHDRQFISYGDDEPMLSSLEPEDDIVPHYIRLFRPMIVKCVDSLHLLPMMRDIFEDQGERTQIKGISRSEGTQAGMEEFLNRLTTKKQHPDRWTRFVHALKEADYEYVSKVLEKQEVIHTDIFTTQTRLIDIFAHEIYKKLKPSEIVPDLFAKRVINRDIKDAVMIDERNNGEASATIVLIDNIWRCKKNWYKIFLEVLYNHDYGELVKKIDDSFLEKRKQKLQEDEEHLVSSDFDEGKGALSKETEKSQRDKSEQSSDKSKSRELQREISHNSMSPNKQEQDKTNSIQEDYLSKTFEVEKSVNNLSGNPLEESLDIEFAELSQNFDESLSIHGDTEQTRRKLTDGYDADNRTLSSNLINRNLSSNMDNRNLSSNVDNRSLSSNVDNRSLQSNTDNRVASYPDLDSMAVVNACQSLDREVESSTSRPNIINSGSSGSLMETNKRVNLDESDDDDEDLAVPKEKLELRSYQMELARPSLEGKNSVIVAPTGSGKTHVALYIIKDHMEKIKSVRHPKVIFLVEQSALAEQQGKQCMTYLPYKVKVITGETQRNERMKTLNEWIERRDLLVVTAQILLNALRDGIVSVTDFSLMVFDECHHANDNHSYNMIMNKYLDIKFQERENAKNLPMIVGMTASVGVGKASDEERAKRHIEKVMANMDAEMIVTVTENRRELAQHVNIPQQKLYKVHRREKNYYGTLVEKLMDATEKHMKNSKYLELVKSPDAVIKPPLEKGSDQYTQWVSMLWRETAKINDQAAGRFYDTCRRYLDLYNKALIIYKDARPSDSLSFILKETKKWEQTVIADETERKMKRMFDKTKDLLEKCTEDPKHKNPKLEALKHMIVEYFKENPDSRVIVFVKTKELVKAIETFMNETDELRNLNPKQFVGVQANKEKGGMTKVEQDEILRLFREGNHKVIIATSVAEEGLDIQKCSLVVRYDHVTNEIAMVQSRGRGRAEDSKFVILASEDTNTQKKAELNMIKESWMNKAIASVREELNRDKDAVLRRVREIQHEAKIARDIALKNRKAAQANLGEFKITCKSCRNFICMSTDIKKIENAHHAAINEDIMENVNVMISVPDYQDENMSCGAGKIFCNKCGNPLGNITIYKNAQFCILKCEFLNMIDSAGNGVSKKRWKQVPFFVPPLTSADLEKRIEGEKYIES